jgi:hypothetical protein
LVKNQSEVHLSDKHPKLEESYRKRRSCGDFGQPASGGDSTPGNPGAVSGSFSTVSGDFSTVYGSSGTVYGSLSTVSGDSGTVSGDSVTVYGSSVTVYGSSGTVYGDSVTVYGNPTKLYEKPGVSSERGQRERRQAGCLNLSCVVLSVGQFYPG